MARKLRLVHPGGNTDRLKESTHPQMPMMAPVGRLQRISELAARMSLALSRERRCVAGPGLTGFFASVPIQIVFPGIWIETRRGPCFPQDLLRFGEPTAVG